MKALIIGGGIAGPVTAMALQKAGIDAVIYEASPAGTNDAGAFLTVMDNGLDALRVIGVHDQVVARSFPVTRSEVFTAAGVLLGKGELGGRYPGITGPRGITRAALSQLMREEAIRRGITVEHGRNLLAAVPQPDGGVAVSFADGSHAEGDLLVGADGLRSTVRTIIDAAAPQPRFAGLQLVYGYASGPAASHAPETFRVIAGDGTMLGYLSAPDGRIWWFAYLPGPELTTAAPAEDWRERLLEAFPGGNTPAAGIVRAAEDPILATRVHDIASLPVWHRRSMVVIGDAAHTATPNAGQGASMAIEDGIELARCLRDLPEVSQAFAAYERLRRARVERLVAASAELAAARLPGAPRRPPSNGDWLYSYHIDWDEPVTP